MDKAAKEIWTALQEYAKSIYSRPTYDVWIEPASFERIENDQIFIKLPNETAKRKWTEDLQGKIIELAYQYTGRDLIPVFECPSLYDSEIQRTNEKKENLRHVMTEKEKIVKQNRQKVDEIASASLQGANLNPDYTFENFIEGESNKFAYTAATVAAEDSTTYNPLLIYGDTGLGKTHLMQAVGHDLLHINPNAKVLYVSCIDFVNDYIKSLQNKSMDDFRERYNNVDLLLVDDIQYLESKTETQNEFFHTFETIYNRGGQVIITSDQPIDLIPTLQGRIVSRFKRGVNADINPPDYETRLAILKEKSKASSLQIPDEGLDYIASTIKSNVRELEGVLKNIKLLAISKNQTEITLNLIREALSREQNKEVNNDVTITEIQQVVCEFYNIKLNDIRGKSRKREIVYPRHIASYLARELTDSSLPSIAKEFGGRDHTTIMHSIEKIEKMIKTDQQVSTDVEEIKNKIKYR